MMMKMLFRDSQICSNNTQTHIFKFICDENVRSCTQNPVPEVFHESCSCAGCNPSSKVLSDPKPSNVIGLSTNATLCDL